MGANPEFIAKRAKSATRHGEKRRSGATVEYKTWLGMKRRCYDSKCKDYANYGGRGIRVCDRWNDSFENFLADMGRRPRGSYSIDRKRVNGNYEPDNCRWATMSQQASENTRCLKPVTVAGITYKSIKDACRQLGVPYTRTWGRLERGDSIERAFTQRRVSRWD